MEATKDINRIKVVLVEKKRTNKWLAEQLKKDPATSQCLGSGRKRTAELFFRRNYPNGKVGKITAPS